jgi:hypothetical protein
MAKNASDEFCLRRGHHGYSDFAMLYLVVDTFACAL